MPRVKYTKANLTAPTAGYGRPAPTAGMGRPAPMAGYGRPAPTAGYGRPAPMAGWDGPRRSPAAGAEPDDGLAISRSRGKGLHAVAHDPGAADGRPPRSPEERQRCNSDGASRSTFARAFQCLATAESAESKRRFSSRALGPGVRHGAVRVRVCGRRRRAVGAVGLAVMLPSALVGPLAGAVADRGRRARVAAMAAAARSLLLAATALAMFLGLPLVAVTILAALASMPARVFRPAQVAVLPRLTRSESELNRRSPSEAAIENLGSVAGPAAGGRGAGRDRRVRGDGGLQRGDACGGVVRGGSRRVRRADSVRRIAPRPTHCALTSSPAGALIARARPSLRLVFSVYAVQTAVFGVPLRRDASSSRSSRFEAGEGGVGLLNAALGVGGIVGGALALLVADRLANGPALQLGTLLWGLPLVLLAAFRTWAPAFALLTVVGVGNVFVDVSSLRADPARDRRRVPRSGCSARLEEMVAVGSVAARPAPRRSR